MATDQTPPGNRIILVTAIGTVVTLTAAHFLFESYFDGETRFNEGRARASADERAVGEPTDPAFVRSDAVARLARGNLSQQMKRMALALGRGTRTIDAITPEPSQDVGALEGWTLLPNPARAARARAAAGVAPSASTDPNAPPASDTTAEIDPAAAGQADPPSAANEQPAAANELPAHP